MFNLGSKISDGFLSLLRDLLILSQRIHGQNVSSELEFEINIGRFFISFYFFIMFLNNLFSFFGVNVHILEFFLFFNWISSHKLLHLFHLVVVLKLILDQRIETGGL